MKRLGLFFVLICCWGASFSQELTEWGLVVSGQFSGLSGADASNMGVYFDPGKAPDGRNFWEYAQDSSATPSGGIGFSIGGYATALWMDLFYTRAELSYNYRTIEYNLELPVSQTYSTEFLQSIGSATTVLPGTRRYEITASYLEMPILVGFVPFEPISVYLGPQFGLGISQSMDVNIFESPHDNVEAVKTYGDAEVEWNAFQVGYALGVSYLFGEQYQLGLRYASYLTSIVGNSYDPSISFWSLQAVGSFNFNLW